MLPPELERQIIDKLIKFDTWVRSNVDALHEMRMKDEEDEENETDESYSRN